MKIRRHSGDLDQSMETVREIEPTRWAVAQYIAAGLGVSVDPEGIEVRRQGRDDRIGWDTHLVTWNGAAVGYTNGPIDD